MANTNQLVLRALQYDKEFLASDEDVNCNKFRQLVSWIEDAKIRLYKVEDRASLRDFSDKAWNQTFEKYLKALECSYNSTDGRVLQWLLNYALSLEYRDNGRDPYSNVKNELSLFLSLSLCDPCCMYWFCPPDMCLFVVFASRA
jgi:hypothetical protein